MHPQPSRSISILAIAHAPGGERPLDRCLGDATRHAWPHAMQLTCVADAVAARQAIERGRFDAVLLPVAAPAAEGLSLLRDVLATAPDVPIIALADAELGIQAVRAGAAAYVREDDASGGRLADAVRSAVERQRHAGARRPSAGSESETWYRWLFEHSLDGILLTAPEEEILMANPALCQLLGYTEQELRALGRSGVLDTADPALTALIEQRRSAGRFFGELTCITRDRRRIPVDVTSHLVVDERGRELSSTFVRDATARKEAEEALRTSEARMRAVANLVPDLLWQSEPDGSATWYNERWYAYTGQTPAEAAGFGWMAVIHPDDREASLTALLTATASEPSLRREHRIRGADGTYRWFLVRAEPLRDDAARVTQWFGAATDVHEQRVALEAAEAARVEADAARRLVERRVVERTAELARANAALIAEAAERARAEVERDALRRRLVSAEEEERRRLARELHDQLGQHLTAVTFGLDEARRLTPANAPPQRLLAQLQELAGAMTRDARHIAVELRPPELDDLGLESALATCVAQWAERYGVAAELAVTGLRASGLKGEVGTMLYRVAQEALTNVARHAAATQVSVIVEQSDGAVRLIIEDDGRGFDGEAVARRPATGGLGLAGMRERTALVGGTLTVESMPGSGTTIYVSIPIDDTSGMPRPPGAAMDPSP